MTDHRPLLDIAGIAEYLGVTVRHVRRLVAERRIPYIKWGSHLHFDPAEIDSWVDGHRRPTAGPPDPAVLMTRTVVAHGVVGPPQRPSSNTAHASTSRQEDEGHA